MPHFVIAWAFETPCGALWQVFVDAELSRCVGIAVGISFAFNLGLTSSILLHRAAPIHTSLGSLLHRLRSNCSWTWDPVRIEFRSRVENIGPSKDAIDMVSWLTRGKSFG